MQVAEAGSGYSVGRGRVYGGPRFLAVTAAGDAFLAVAHASSGNSYDLPVREEAWGNVYRSGQGWGAPVRLVGDASVPRNAPIGLGWTPDGACFGWRHDTGGGLRIFELRAGWLSPRTLLPPASGRRAWSFVTDSLGLPAVLYVEGARTFVLRDSGPPAPELLLETAAPDAFAFDGSGNLAAASYEGELAVRLPDGRLVRARVPAPPGAAVTRVVLAGRPAGGFVVGWVETGPERATYSVAEADAAGSVGPRTLVGSVPPVPSEPTLGVLYEARPRIVAGADGAVIAWRAGADLYVARQRDGLWERPHTLPGAAVSGGLPRLGATLPFDVALGPRGALLVVWTRQDSLVCAQLGQGQAWSEVARLGASASDPRLAMNDAGTAFAAWREGSRVLAARSPGR